MTATGSSTGTAGSSTADREIVITRLLDAPREVVFEAFTDPAHIGEWWGPNGFTNTIHEMHVTPGGVWRYIIGVMGWRFHGVSSRAWRASSSRPTSSCTSRVRPAISFADSIRQTASIARWVSDTGTTTN